jgi:phthiodiolone/phenolphthiodiolone dimycocerosates ketoreductase
MRLGLLLPTMQSVDVNRAALSAAEQVGVDDVWVLDHMMGLTHPAIWPLFPAAQALPDPDALLDPFCVAAALGPTTDLPLGTCVTDATYAPQEAPRVIGEQLPRLRALLRQL